MVAWSRDPDDFPEDFGQAESFADFYDDGWQGVQGILDDRLDGLRGTGDDAFDGDGELPDAAEPEDEELTVPLAWEEEAQLSDDEWNEAYDEGELGFVPIADEAQLRADGVLVDELAPDDPDHSTYDRSEGEGGELHPEFDAGALRDALGLDPDGSFVEPLDPLPGDGDDRRADDEDDQTGEGPDDNGMTWRPPWMR